jgi:hypothetical protein
MEIGYALSHLDCDNGPEHEVTIRFWGREEQPKAYVISWKCTREERGFTCVELGAYGLPPPIEPPR